MRQILNKIISILLAAITVLMIASVGLAVIQMGANRGVPTLFNHSFFVVTTGSMEPTLPVGVGIIIEKVDVSTLKPQSFDEETNEVIYEGDILTFFSGERIVTHRLIAIEPNLNQPDKYGPNKYFTQGDCEGCSIDAPLYQADIIGRVVYVSPTIGFIYRAASNRWLILVIVVVPLALLTFFEGRTLIKAWKEKKEDTNTDKNLEKENNHDQEKEES